MSTPAPAFVLRDARLVPVGGAPVPGEVPDAPVDVRVAGGRVVEVGPSLARAPGEEETSAGGRWLVPGLWDQHVHLAQWTLTSQRLDLAWTRTPEDVVAAVAHRVQEQGPGGPPVVGWGHRAGTWERDATVTELDAVSGDTPVVLISGDAHHAWINTVGLLWLALPVRDAVVREVEWFDAYSRLPSLLGGDGTSPEAYRRALEAAAALGVVGLVDLEFGRGPFEWGERWAEGADVLRVRAATYAETLDDVLAAGVRTGDVLPGGDERLTMGPLKIISDGSLNTRTAWCCEPYGDAHRLEHPAGQPNLPADELRALLTRARDGGLEVATHAIGDRAAAAALEAYAATGARGSIEHAQLLRRQESRRMAELGLRASVQPAHLLDDRDLSERVWGDRAERCFAFRWMLDDGVELVLGSDAPVSPLDPWLAMAAAVHRSADERAPWHPEQALTAAEALAASVDGQPTVGPGSRADLVLLDADPLAVGDGFPGGGAGPVSAAEPSASAAERSAEAAAQLRRIGSVGPGGTTGVAATWVAGRLVHDAR